MEFLTNSQSQTTSTDQDQLFIPDDPCGEFYQATAVTKSKTGYTEDI